MHSLYAILTAIVLVGCGDNIKPDVDPPDPDKPTAPDVGPIDQDPDIKPGGDPVYPDAGVPPVDPPLDDKRSACCIGMLNGNVPKDCGPPPGTCKFDSICEGVALYLCTP